MKKNDLARMIDHTLLKADATRADIIECCNQARKYGFASVCINPCHVSVAASELKGTDVKVCTVIGFPLGANTTAVKAFEAERAVEEGAAEIDMVINIGALKAGDYRYVEDEIGTVVEVSKDAVVKVIIETCYLSEDEIVKACELAKKAGADFVKTSTGYGSAGASAANVALMRKTVGDGIGVKASGGIRSLKDAETMLDAGADRLGTSSGVKIMNEQSEKQY